MRPLTRSSLRPSGRPRRPSSGSPPRVPRSCGTVTSFSRRCTTAILGSPRNRERLATVRARGAVESAEQPHNAPSAEEGQ
eukprot:1605397-Prymnesium_polylepis.1